MLVICMSVSFIASACVPNERDTAKASRAPIESISLTAERLPDMPGIGLAAAYAGASNGYLLVAGGTNFPNGMPWEGGKKQWSSAVHAWSPTETWRVVGELPRSAAGGACATTAFGVLCAGGSNAREVFADSFLLRFEHDRLVREPLPPLPTPLSGLSAVAVGSAVFVLGGHGKTDVLAEDPQRLLLSIDLAAPRREWVSHPPIPGAGRHLAVVATDGHALYAFSGMGRDVAASGTTKLSFLRDAYKYTPNAAGATSGAWRRLADLPRSFAAAPSPAPMVMGSVIFLGGGVDEPDIVAPMDKRNNLDANAAAYDIASGAARIIGRVPVSVVVAPAIPWRDGVVIATGEIRAGHRTPQVWTYRPQRQ
jgi:N-acetylneuraminic acid mutarotase